jgi:hypothetical protein
MRALSTIYASTGRSLVQGVPLKRALYFIGVANSESMIGGAPVT